MFDSLQCYRNLKDKGIDDITAAAICDELMNMYESICDVKNFAERIAILETEIKFIKIKLRQEEIK